MKTQTKSDRKIKPISPGRWITYATAGAATALTCANSAEAEIHYSGDVSIRLAGNAHANLPLSNGASLFFKAFFGGSTFLQDFKFIIKGAISGSARGHDYGFSRIFLSNLPAGRYVSHGRFYSVAGNPERGVLFTNWSDGQFDATKGFVGFRFNTGNGTQYGWARIETRNTIDNTHIHDLIKDYAWGDPGDAILTGQKHSLQPGNAKSVTGSLGLLAFGSQGLDAWRAQRPHKSD